VANDARSCLRDPSQHSADAYRVTRLGEQTLQYGLARLAAAERLGVTTLHSRIGQRVEQQFLLGEFEQAVFIAAKEVEIRVRELAGAPSSLIGVPLMQQAFAPNGPGPLADTSADGAEQVAMMDLFKGAIGLFKNPSSHRPVNYDDPTLASEIALFADLLHRLLDQVSVASWVKAGCHFLLLASTWLGARRGHPQMQARQAGAHPPLPAPGLLGLRASAGQEPSDFGRYRGSGSVPNCPHARLVPGIPMDPMGMHTRRSRTRRRCYCSH